MSPNKRRAAGVLVVGLGVLALGLRLTRPRRAPAPLPSRPQAGASYVHPIVPSLPVVRPPPPGCRARDLQDVALSIHRLEKKLVAVAARGTEPGAAAGCRAADRNLGFSSDIDLLSKITSGCTARDATLDGQWSEVEAAVLALGECLDCTRPRARRTLSCARADDFASEAQKAAR